MKKNKLKNIIVWTIIAIVSVGVIFLLQRYVGTKMTVQKQTKEKVREIDMIARFNQDLNSQGTSDELDAIKSDLDATDFSKLDLGLLE